MSGAAWPLGLAVVLLEELRVRRARAKRYASATSVPSKANAVKAVRFEPSVVDGECGERSEAAVGSAAMINSAVRCLRADIKDLRAEVAELGAAAKGHLSGATSPMSVLSAQTSLEADLSDYSEEEDEESEWSELAEASGEMPCAPPGAVLRRLFAPTTVRTAV
jgi:hypothetical protein|mmetsp:Transcript_21402/g.66366  ORF Transcript_21402/g.66366 Transcript_21402/m.66366 type:complete len:164 (-) Transcript_21402:381-872(-)